METDAGKRWKAAWSGRLDRGTSAYLIMEYGIFGKADEKGHAAWNWYRDGNMAVSCQYTAVSAEYLCSVRV